MLLARCLMPSPASVAATHAKAAVCIAFPTECLCVADIPTDSYTIPFVVDAARRNFDGAISLGPWCGHGVTLGAITTMVPLEGVVDVTSQASILLRASSG